MPRTRFDLNPEHPFDEKWTAAQARYKSTITTFARNCVAQLPGMSIEDIEQELLVELWKCVVKYDPNRGASFNTLFQGCARNRVITLVRTSNTQSRKVNYFAYSLDTEEMTAAVESALAGFSTEERMLKRMELQEYISTHGIEVLDMARPPAMVEVA